MRHSVFGRQFLTAVSAKLSLLLLSIFFFAIFARAEWRVAVAPAAPAYSPRKAGGMALLSAGGTMVTTNETEATPEIRALARALDNDPKLIYEYVRNHIAYGPPTYGCVNGAHGCLMAGRGNDWDQAALLTSLLRTAGYTTRFGHGLVRYTRTDLAAWMGVTASAVSNVIMFGGNPCYYDSEAPDEYLMQRLWIEAQIGGTWYTFDPAFKTYQSFQRPDLRAAMGYTESAFLTSATSGATVTTDYVRNANETNIGASLTAYATNLVRFIQTNNPLMSVEELIGGRKMLFETLTNYPTSLPKAISIEGMSDTWDHMPSTNHLVLTIRHGGSLLKAFNGYEVAGERLSLYFDSANGYRPLLYLGGIPVATGNTTTVGTTYDLVVGVDHPYRSVRYCDMATTNHVVSGQRYVIMHDFEGMSPSVIAAANRQLARAIALGLSTNAESVFAGGLEVTALSGLQQWSLSRQIFSTLSDVVGYAQHFTGIIGQESGYYVDIPGVLVTVNSGIQSNADEKAWFKALTLFASALEHGVLEQSQGSDKKCASTIKLLQIGNGNGKKTFLATSANWTNAVKNSLTNYTAAMKTQIEDGINAGSSFVLPENAKITNQQWVGLGYVEYTENGQEMGMGMIISGGYNGGYGGTTATFSVPASANTVSTAYSYYPPASVSITTARDPVDLHTGNLIADQKDLIVGNGLDPQCLTLTRNYNSGQNYRAASLGYGWTHSYDIGVRVVSHGDPSFGLRRPEDATPLIVQSIVALDLMQGTPDAREWISASLATKWAMDQVINNAAIVRTGARSLAYIRLPDGAYVAPAGVTATLRKQGSSFVMEDRFGVSYLFNSNGTLSVWRDADSNSVSFTYNTATNVTIVSNSFGRVLSFNYNGTLVNSVSDNAGRRVAYTYTGSNLTSVVDTGSNTWSYTYDTNRCLTVMRDPFLRMTISNTYDAVGKVQSQMNGMSNVWDFYISGWRGVEEDPQGGRTTHYFDDDGRNLGTQDALSNRTYNVYDTQGHLLMNVDARGYPTVYQYDSHHNVTNRIDAVSNRTAYTYDAAYRLTAVADPLGHVTRYDYDSKHHLTNIVDAATNIVTLTYTTKGQLWQRIEDNGQRVATYTYDGYGNPISLTRTDGGTESNQYETIVGNLLTHIDANRQTNRFTWDSRRLMTSWKDAVNNIVSNVYDGAGLLIKTIDRNRNTNQTSYTATYKPDTVTLPNGGIIQYRYDSRNWLISVADPLVNITSNEYDAAGRLIRVVNPLRHAVSNSYDANGNLITVRDPEENVTSNQFDALNRLVCTEDPTHHVVSNEYNEVGWLTARVDQEDKRTEYEYDALGRVMLERRRNLEYQFDYDAAGNLVTFLNPTNARTGFGYDKMGRCVAITNPLLRVTRYVFDPVGNLKQRINANGQTNYFYYDVLNRITNLQSTIQNVKYSYDPNGNLTNMIDALGTNRQMFNSMNLLTKVVDPFGLTVSNEYNLAGWRTQIVYPDSKTEQFAYDGNGSMTNAVVSAFGMGTASYEYDSRNNLHGAVLPGGLLASYSHDEVNRLSSWWVSKAGSNVIERSCARNGLGFKETESIQAGLEALDGPSSQARAHNAADQLASIAQSTPSSTNIVSFDGAGNTTQVVLSVKGQTFTTIHRYDYDNRLLSATRLRNNPQGQSVTTSVVQLEYDGQGLLLRITDNGVVRRLARDRIDQLARPLVETDASGNTVRWFVWANGRLLAQVQSNGTARIALSDELGRLLAFTDNNGALTDEFAYHPYGRLIAHSGTTETPFAWLGAYGIWDAGHGLYLTRHRAYDANLCRFLSTDPIGIQGGLNLYVYGSDNPLAFLDPLGLWTLSLGVALSGQLGSFGGTAGFGVGISHDPSASLLSGWNAGVLGFAGYGLETPGASASFTFEPAYSGNPNLEDLSGGAMEIGGSVTPISGGPSVGGSYAQDTCGHKPLITFPSFGLGIGTPELHVFDVHTGVLSFDDARSSSTRPPK